MGILKMSPFAPSHVDEDNISICTELLSDEEHEYMDDAFPISDADEDSDDNNDSDVDTAKPESGLEGDAESQAGSDEEGATAGDEAEDEAEGDAEDEAEENEDGSGPKKTVYGNFGWADAMSKVLAVGKTSGKKSIILAKAKKDADIMKVIAAAKKEEPLSFKIDGEIKVAKAPVTEDGKIPETHTEKMARRQRRKEWDLVGRVLPDFAADRETEKVLGKIGTRGVVQLFNSVKTQQKTMQDRLREAGPLERKREKALNSMNKSDFLALLQGGNKNKKVKLEDSQVKEEPSSWNVLRDDFMPEVKMRDWDKVDSTDSDDNN